MVNNKLELPIGIFNTALPVLEERKIILGQEPGLLDTINRTDEVLFKHYKNLKDLDWDENEFRYALCLPEFAAGDEDAGIMIDTIAWQWETDTVIARILMKVIGSFVTDSDAIIGYSKILENECLTPDHEVLTPNGWKTIDKITLDDKVAQWNYESHFIEFINPTDIISKPYSGPMYHFHSTANQVSQVVTPNHRMPVVYPYWTTDNDQYKEASVVKYHGGNALPSAGFLHGSRRMTPQEKLYLAVQADGSLCSKKYTGENTGKLHYKFGFKKQRKIDRLFYLCQQAGWEVREIASNEDLTRDIRTFYVYVPVNEYNWEAKTFNWFSLDEVGYDWAVDFVEELRYWDGNISASESIRYISSNKECIDKAQALGHLIGLRAHITVIPARKNVIMPNGSVSNTKEAYQLNFTHRPYVVGNAINKNVIEYTGTVHCLTVPSSYFLIRHNDSVSVTGNCLHALTYSEIAKTAFTDPNLIMNQVLMNKEAHARLLEPALIFEEARIAACKYELGLITREEVLPTAILFFAALPTLERAQFMPSFAVTFAYGEVGRFRAVANGIQKICQDEFEVHIPFNKAVFLRCIATHEGRKAFELVRPRIITLLNAINKSEFEWVDQLFNNRRSVAGLTKESLAAYNDYSATDMALFFGIEDEVSFEIIKQDPLPYMKGWVNISKTQKSPQEEDPNQYKLNIIERNDHDLIYDTKFIG